MTQWYGAVLGVLVASVLLLLSVELGIRMRRRPRRRPRRRSPPCKPIFQVQRNGRVRFELEDLRRSALIATRRLPRPDPAGAVPEVESTLPDLFTHQGVPRQRPPDWVD